MYINKITILMTEWLGINFSTAELVKHEKASTIAMSIR